MRCAGWYDDRIARLHFARRLTFHIEGETSLHQIGAFRARMGMAGDLGFGGDLRDPKHRFIVRPCYVGFLQNGPLDLLICLLRSNRRETDASHQHYGRDAKRRLLQHSVHPFLPLR